jgi:hypothetical protein
MRQFISRVAFESNGSTGSAFEFGLICLKQIETSTYGWDDSMILGKKVALYAMGKVTDKQRHAWMQHRVSKRGRWSFSWSFDSLSTLASSFPLALRAMM